VLLNAWNSPSTLKTATMCPATTTTLEDPGGTSSTRATGTYGSTASAQRTRDFNLPWNPRPADDGVRETFIGAGRGMGSEALP